MGEKFTEQQATEHEDRGTLFIWLSGNLSDGFTAVGPYQSLDDVCEAHDCDEGWLMVLESPVRSEKVAA
jgi:hypothetical protein